MTVDLDAAPITHVAEQQALLDLLAQLEQTDITAVTRSDIEPARAEVAKNMGW